MTFLPGARVTLRPVRADEFDALWTQRLRRAGEWQVEVDEPAREQLRRRIAGSGEFNAGEVMLGIEVNGRLAGEIQARQPAHGLPPGVFELGIEIYDQDNRGKGAGTEAVALMASHLFELREAHRVQVSTDARNRSMRGVLERLGFGFEGVLRGFMPSGNGPLDYAMYGMTKDDWGKRKGAWIFKS